jgi:hypothetical protein
MSESESNWKISGGIGQVVPVNPNFTPQSMLQGIGFPLRQVDNVPSPELEGQYPDAAVAQGLFMQWMGVWSAGLFYPKGSYVTDSGFACVANKITLDKPAPVPSEAPTTSLPTPWAGAVTQQQGAIVESGQTYTITSDGWIKGLRVQVPELLSTTNYRIIIIDRTDPNNLITQVIEEPILVAGDWSVVALLNRIVKAGTVLQITLDSLNSGSDTSVDGGWFYQGPTNIGVIPIAQNWTIDNGRTVFRINKFDLDGTDRGTELEGVIVGSKIAVVQTDDVGNTSNFNVRTVVDEGTYMRYGVTLLSETGGGVALGAATTIEIDIPIPLPTKYDEQTGVWGVTDPSWATVEGFLSFNGVKQAVPTSNAYGVDIEFEPAAVSEDWDIVALTT